MKWTQHKRDIQTLRDYFQLGANKGDAIEALDRIDGATNYTLVLDCFPVYIAKTGENYMIVCDDETYRYGRHSEVGVRIWEILQGSHNPAFTDGEFLNDYQEAIYHQILSWCMRDSRGEALECPC